MSSAGVQTTCFTIAANDYPEQKDKYIGYLEGAAGFGCIVGPALGALLYS